MQRTVSCLQKLLKLAVTKNTFTCYGVDSAQILI